MPLDFTECDQAAAEAAGFRLCLRCRPETAPFSSAWIGSRATVERDMPCSRSTIAARPAPARPSLLRVKKMASLLLGFFAGHPARSQRPIADAEAACAADAARLLCAPHARVELIRWGTFMGDDFEINGQAELAAADRTVRFAAGVVAPPCFATARATIDFPPSRHSDVIHR